MRVSNCKVLIAQVSTENDCLCMYYVLLIYLLQMNSATGMNNTCEVVACYNIKVCCSTLYVECQRDKYKILLA